MNGSLKCNVMREAARVLSSPLQRYKDGFSRLKDGESSATWPGDVANTMSAPYGLTAGWLSRRMMLGVRHWGANVAG
ncbi:hypothetical protein QQF64_004227 [Cirrhinus molitorella]|uniref:Brain-derived neurotrophic factor n=1 Tax=Cirrhinus molitorella TaxID=172907 RepID=A0ABR3MFJ9_9TELE